jgi:hypothetical protein
MSNGRLSDAARAAAASAAARRRSPGVRGMAGTSEAASASGEEFKEESDEEEEEESVGSEEFSPSPNPRLNSSSRFPRLLSSHWWASPVPPGLAAERTRAAPRRPCVRWNSRGRRGG